MTAEEQRLKLESDILLIMEEKLKNGQMDPERAQSIARMVLKKLHPPLTLEELYAIVPTLDDHFTELAQAVLPVMKEHEVKVRDVISEHAERLIKSGQLDEARKILHNTLHSQK